MNTIKFSLRKPHAIIVKMPKKKLILETLIKVMNAGKNSMNYRQRPASCRKTQIQ